ncbi:soluble quino protein glucose/sorbosone dehydrogenase [Rhypophila decipiens]|uniref:Soluble quino protein glucose/sorbosone dehydrogenase n=1 Tax=Rhypophila decipiens TaxID=261697 RepID=A0AAN6Y3G6_9PEZI|nr:soluble quino protein glucose/sorbosone dehydrogenase [Rhypophila decipiens]
MKKTTRTAAFAAGLSASAVVAQGTTCPSILTPNYNTPTVAAGWQAQLVVGGLIKPRSLEFDDTGALMVVESGKGVTRHTFIDNGGTCLTLEKSDILIDEPSLNHGLAIDPNGRIIYASSAESVYRYEFNARTSSVGSNPPLVLVNKMSNNDLVTRTLLMSKKQRGTLLVSRGVPDGDELRAETLSNGLSQIRAFDLSNLTARTSTAYTYNFNTEGQVLGWGLRNSVGMAEHPVTGGVFAVENSMDGVTRNGQDIHENNPAEELNYLGVLGQSEFAGKNYGFPSCFAVWELDEIPENEGLKVGDQFGVDEDQITDEVCNDESKYEKPRLVMPAHWAPLDIKFDDKGEMAYISFHGSFNKKSPAGYRVSAIPFDSAKGQPKASVADSHSPDAMIDIMTNPDNTVCPGNCFRPAGLAFDSAGRLWMSSDTTGEIFVLTKTDDAGAGVFVLPEGHKGTNAAQKLNLGWGMYAGLVVAGFLALF